MTLLCTVRGCRLPLVREDRRYHCARGHSFDIARSGYVNLLQPQDRRSREPGDAAEAVAARRRLHDRGIAIPFLRVIAEMTEVAADDVVLDAGCGDGFYLACLAEEKQCDPYGVDISLAAVDAAARRYPACHWIVANADRFLPYADASFSLVLSITARMNAAEFRRVLRSDGRLLVAIPAATDLREIRGPGRDRAERTVATFASCFQLADRRQATTSAGLDAAGVRDILLSIYRPLQQHEFEAMRVTFSLDFLLFRPV